MDTKFIFIGCASFLLTLFFGCQKDFKSWEVDSNYDGLFRSLVYEVNSLEATSATIRFTQVVDADRYVFEFSKDSLEFSQIVKTVEVSADTLTPFVASTTPTRVEYLKIFDELDGDSRYSVRMKAIDDQSGRASGLRQLTFLTLSEQLISSTQVAVDRIRINWTPTDRVSHVTVVEARTNTLLREITLSDEHKSLGSLEIENLEPGNGYMVTILFQDVVRGSLTVETSGIFGAQVIALNPQDDIASRAAEAVVEGKTSLIFLLSGGETYNFSSIRLPSGVLSCSLTGELKNGQMPVVRMANFSMDNNLHQQVRFENLILQSSSTNNFVLNLDRDGAKVDHYRFTNCVISDFGSGIVRLNNNVALKSIIFEDCILKRNGGYGLVNIGGSSALVDSVKLQNCTIIDQATQLVDVRVAVDLLSISNCTVVNQGVSMSQLLRFDTNRLPAELRLANNIIAGNNSGGKLNATSYDHGNFALAVSFAGSYRTSELQIERDSRDFSGITVYSGDASSLFVDLQKEDFRIRPANGFGGRAIAGDRRWFE